ncbi:hypothetical protein A2690_00815 [Candidatus Roizmanbacteria bacterium RIFCSPHIGHO2_01_FULL_39_12b]|uniref:Uncharacterized protein n=1 Tax=Candidatus Roizmanbacteria bacterium RIFCSPHIGHO2_01_FULL_39_12b TaxID=1802030 RepID=A0A1F7GAP1_9BACT|nr:MAG: hypothetical protein A2690_00815 [Candidatus Roizmanbacteria bacterium RIFCSPHIGHO2_01_FULL_39_12b]
MTSVSISQIKVNPSRVLKAAQDFPVAIKKRNEIEGYVIGKDLYEKLMVYIENFIDRKAVKETDFDDGVDFEDVAEELGI